MGFEPDLPGGCKCNKQRLNLLQNNYHHNLYMYILCVCVFRSMAKQAPYSKKVEEKK